MSETTWAGLRRHLLDHYEELTQKLSRRLGSVDLAREAIHETYLRFQRMGDIEPVQNPDGFIFKTALNVAKTRWAAEDRYLNASESELLIDIPDETPSPEQTAGARLEMALLQRALEQLPPKRREIFEASWGDRVPHRELAERYGVTIRTIQREVEAANKFIKRFWKENSRGGRRSFAQPESSD
jgi:RNA polymerase sigma-70 factor (ECF subfamily)